MYTIRFNDLTSHADSLADAHHQIREYALRASQSPADVAFVRLDDGIYAYWNQTDADADDTGTRAFAVIEPEDDAYEPTTRIDPTCAGCGYVSSTLSQCGQCGIDLCEHCHTGDGEHELTCADHGDLTRQAVDAFTPTHRITYTPTTGTPQVWDVMAVDDGPAYTREEWETTAPADWECDTDGRFLFRGEAAPGNGTVVVERLI